METFLMNSDNLDYHDDCIETYNWCICNTNLPSLYRLLLHFSYVYTSCNKCFHSRYEYQHRKHIYEYADEDKVKLDLENKDIDEVDIQIKNIIKKNAKILYIKFINITPLEFIDKLDKILEEEDNEPYLKYRHHCEIRRNQHYLYEILIFAKFEYLKYELVKKVAFRYIRNSNHVGNNATLFQLPLEIWEYIFTFI
jgi:hypothetical protein